MRKSATPAVILAAATVLFAGCPGDAFAVAPPTPTSAGSELGPGAITFDLSHDDLVPLFEDASRVLVTGAHNPDNTCRFPSNLYHNPGEKPVGQVSLAYNPSTCTALMLRGHLTHLPPTRLGAPAALAARARRTPGGDPCSGGEDDIWQEDPIGIHVNELTTYINWCYDYNSVTSCSSAEDSYAYPDTHWYVIGGPWNGSAQPDQWNCRAYTYYYVGNDFFRCPQQASVRTLYDFDEEWGNYWGADWDNSWYSTSGTCSNLLSWHQYIL